MPLIAESLSFLTEHLNGQRCEVIRNQALSEQFFIEIIRIAAQTHAPGRLLNLRIRFSATILDQIFERVWTYSASKALPHTLFLAGIDVSHLWFHLCFQSSPQTLITAWQWQLNPNGLLHLRLDHVVHLSIVHRDPLDLCRDHLVYLEHALRKCGHQPLAITVDMEQLVLQIDVHDWMTKLIVASPQRILPIVEGGKTTIQFDGDACWLTYTLTPQDSAQYTLTSENLSPFAFVKNTPQTILFDKKFFENIKTTEFYSILGKHNPNRILVHDDLFELQQAMYEGRSLPPTQIVKALNTAEKTLPLPIFTALLHRVDLWAPEHADAIKGQVLALAASDHPPAIILNLLANIYRREQSDMLLLALLQRQMNASTFCPHRLIRLGIEIVETLAGSLMMYALAVRRLDAMKSLVLQHGSIRELIAFALGYHHAQYSGMAIQCLKQWMKQAVNSGDIAAFGHQLARVMLEHNEPLQKIIDVCTQVLDVEPTHEATLEILAQCLEDSDRPEEAAETWHHCFGSLIHAWELARSRFKALPIPENERLHAQSHARAVRIAETLERLLDGMERAPQRCMIYRDHLRLEPQAVHILARYLKDLESMHYFHEMAQCCEEFLTLNADQLPVNDEISIRLTLHNIYARELHREPEAHIHLTRARQIGALDPRVLTAEIDQCRRQGQTKEHIELLIALIDVLPSPECIHPTLELVRLYESTHADLALIIETLRKTNARCPQQAPILLELRQYLRKTNQWFELASVLEKLAKVTNDLQTRRSILLEASEIQEKLGNHPLAQSLYHEAQLSSPINPIAKPEMPQSLCLDDNPIQLQGFNNQASRLASVVLTSRSISAIAPAIDIPRAISTNSDVKDLLSFPSNSDIMLASSDINVSPHLPSSSAAPLSLLGVFPEESAISADSPVSDSQCPVEEQIMTARQKGNTQDLLNKLLRVIDELPEPEQPPRVLQEIGCIYLYERHDLPIAKSYLERACKLSQEVANGEQTLNALEEIYTSMQCYPELAEIYQKKSEILTIIEEKRKYEIRLAQLRYEHLKETGLAIETLQKLLTHYPANTYALQLLAQIYLETQQLDCALETLERITPLLKSNSKPLSQHLLRLAGIYIEHNKSDEAKRTLRALMEQRQYVDKLAVLEQYKGICRAHDEWHELSSLLYEELSIHLQLNPQNTTFDQIVQKYQDCLSSGHVKHVLREYADVLFYKLKDIPTAIKIYGLLLHTNPEDPYSINVLYEMIEQSDHPHQMLVQILYILSEEGILNRSHIEQQDFETIIQRIHHLYHAHTDIETESWHNQLKTLQSQIQNLIPHAYLTLWNAIQNTEHQAME